MPDDGTVSSTPNIEVNKTFNTMLTEISIMEKATEKQKKISRDVKERLKTLRSLLAVFQSAREEAKRMTRTTRHPKRRRNAEDTPNSLRSRYSTTKGILYNSNLTTAGISLKKARKRD